MFLKIKIYVSSPENKKYITETLLNITEYYASF